VPLVSRIYDQNAAVACLPRGGGGGGLGGLLGGARGARQLVASAGASRLSRVSPLQHLHLHASRRDAPPLPRGAAAGAAAGTKPPPWSAAAGKARGGGPAGAGKHAVKWLAHPRAGKVHRVTPPAPARGAKPQGGVVK